MTDLAHLLARRPAWPQCKVEGCTNEAALGGACAELHGGATPTRTPGGYVLFQHWPDPGDDALDPERWEPRSPSEWQCWCVSRVVWDRWAVDGAWPATPELPPGRLLRHAPALPRFATLGGLGAPQPLSPRAVRTLLREGRVSLIALQEQLEAGTVFFPGLSPDPALLVTALGLLRLAQPLTAEQAATLSRAHRLPPLMPELEPFAREPEPAPWRPPGWGRSLAHKPPTERSARVPLDAFRQHPEWPLPEALIDRTTEDRLIQRLDREAVAG